MDRLVKFGKAQTPLTIVFVLIVFAICWVFFLGKFLGDAGVAAVENNNLDGIEAFVLMNLNLVVGLALLIFIIWAAIAGSRG